MLHLHLSIWRKLSPELWLGKASPLPPHQSLWCPCPLTTCHLTPYPPLPAQDIPQPQRLDQILIQNTWLPPTPEAVQLPAHWPNAGWALKLGCGHFLLKPRLSNWFDSGNTVCFSYHSLVISMLLKRSRRYVFIVQTHVSHLLRRCLNHRALDSGTPLFSYWNHATKIQALILKGLNLQPND